MDILSELHILISGLQADHYVLWSQTYHLHRKEHLSELRITKGEERILILV